MYFTSFFFLFYMWLLETLQVSYGAGINTSMGSSALAWTVRDPGALSELWKR